MGKANANATSFADSTVTVGGTYYYRIRAFNGNGQSDFSNIVTIVPSATGSGTGLRGTYFNNKTLTVPSALVRTDSTINFDWGNGSYASGQPTDNFSARWEGQVEAPVSGTYTFTTNSDDGVRLWVNGVQIINNWTDHGPTDNSGTITLTAGTKYDITMEYYENGGGAVAKLDWAYPGQAQQIIPQARLYPATGGGGGSGPLVTSARFYPRSGFPSRMNGGQFQGSNDNVNWTTLAVLSGTPTDNAWSTIAITTSTRYRYLRYLSPNGGYGNIAELEFYSGSTKLTGTGFGTAGSWNNSGNTFSKALDGSVSTFFDAPSADGNFIGLDLP